MSKILAFVFLAGVFACVANYFADSVNSKIFK
jgi:hypothetical protein